MANTREIILSLLLERRGRFVSGEELAGTAGISRAAVWKAVRALREEGFVIEAGKGSGYMLSTACDRLSAAGIRAALPADLKDMRIEAFSTIDSTNSYAKRLVADGIFHTGGETLPVLIAANAQTAGRGRLGRSFYSPADTGVYFSLLFHAGTRFAEFLPVTVAAAVAVCRVVERVGDEKPGIKWVNDVWIGDKKVCGILTEGMSDLENGRLEAAIVGIGINVTTANASFPSEVQETAASLGGIRATRDELVAGVTAELIALSRNLKDPALMEEYRARSVILGREIWWEADGTRHTGLAKTIDDDGGLVTETADGIVILKTGEVSVRPVPGALI